MAHISCVAFLGATRLTGVPVSVALSCPARLVASTLVSALVASTVQFGAVSTAQAESPAWRSQTAAAPVASEPELTDPMSRARASGERVADRSKWDGVSRTYAKPDGTWTTEVSPTPVNYRDAEGVWQPIDSTLVASARAGFAAESKAGPAKVLLPEDADQSPVRLEDEQGGWLTFRMKDAHGAPQVKESSATIADGPGTSTVRLDSMPWGVKETITLPAAPDVAPVYSYDLRLSAGLTPTLNEHNQIVVTDGVGDQRFQIAAPFMQDASSGFDDTSRAVPQSLDRAGSGWRLTMRPDHAWLTDPARVYPVAIDPTATVAALRDTFMNQEVPTTTHNGTWLRVGSNAGATQTNRRSLIQFNLGSESIPAAATVTNSTLDLYLVSWLNTTQAEYAVRAMKPAGRSDGTDWNSNATWNTSGTGTAWVGAGIPAPVGGTYYFGAGPDRLIGAGAGYRSWDVTSTVAGWLATPANSNGFLIKAVTEPSPNELRFVSSADGNPASQKPKLTVNWEDPPPTITAGSLQVSDKISTTTPVTTRVLTPTLSATASDPNSPSIGYKFEVVDDATGGVVASTTSSKTNPSPGTPVSFSYTVPANALAEGKTYTAKFSVSDETTTAGPSQTLKFKVDQAPTAPTDLKVDPATTSSPWVTPVIDPQLSAVIADPGSTVPVKAVFEMQKQGGTTYEVGADEVDPGGRAGYTVPPDGPDGLGALVPGATYEFRVGAQDELAQGQTTPPTVWSGWVAFTVAQNAHTSVPLQLAEPLTVWHSGPDLSWTPYRDSSSTSDDLAEYQIFRSCVTLPDNQCTNPVSTYQQANTPGLVLVDAVPPGTLDFRDREALPSSLTSLATYRYWIVARTKDDKEHNRNGATASNSRDVETPRQGRVRRIFTGDLPDTTLNKADPDAKFPDVLQAGNDVTGGGRQRALLGFDVSVIEPGMRITQASVETTQATTGNPGAFGLYAINTRDFIEGEADWNQASNTDDWTTAGGDLDSSPMSQVTTTSTGKVTFADPTGSSTMRTAVQKWVNDKAANHGVAIRAVDETTTGGRRFIDLVPSESRQQDPATLTETRPRLIVEHVATSVMDTISAPDLPQRYVPNTVVSVPVTVTNTTDTPWPTGLQLSYRWTLPEGTDDEMTSADHRYAELFPGTNTTRALQPGESVVVNLPVATPINSDTGGKELFYDLHLDLWTGNAWWTDGVGGYRYYDETQLTQAQKDARKALLDEGVCAMTPTALKCPRRVVQSATSNELGLEKFASYTGEETGAGSQLLTNLNNGNLIWSYDAMSNPSVGPSFFLRVAYNTQGSWITGNELTGTMGYGWSVQPGTLSRLNTKLILNSSADKAVTLTDGDGTQHIWKNPTNTTVVTYDRPAGIHLDLTYDGSRPMAERYRFTRPDGTRFYYDGTTLLPTKVVDVSENTLTYIYVNDRLDRVIDAKNREVATLGYTGAKLAWVRDIAGRALVLDYDPENPNQIKSIRDGDPFNERPSTEPDVKTFAFNYAGSQSNAHSVLTRVTDPRGYSTNIGYYENNTGPFDPNASTYPHDPTVSVPSWVMGQVRSISDRNSQKTYVEYFDSALPPPNVSMPAGAARYSRVFDMVGSETHTTTYGIDAYGRTIELKDANAHAPGAPADTADDATRLGWDADHNVVRMEEANDQAVSRWLYHPKTGYPRKIWDAEAVKTGGKPTEMTYHPATPEGAVMLASVTSPLGKASKFDIDSKGRLTAVTDPEEGKIRYEYTVLADGRIDGTLAKTIDPRGNETTYKYPVDALNVGYPTLVTPPQTTTAPGDTEADKPTSFEYDARGAVETTTRAGLETLADYDIFGRTKFVTVPGAQGGSRTTDYTYDLNDNTLTVKAPNSAVTTTTYRADDQAKTTTLPDNGSGTRIVAFGYDPLGRLCREMAPNAGATGEASCASSEGAVPPAFASDYWYDRLGQLKSVTQRDPKDATKAIVTSYTYDNVGNVIAVRDPNKNRAGTSGNTTEVKYDLNHRQTSVIDALGYASRVVYDADGQVVRSVDQAGKVTRFTYDKAGRNKTTTVSYNPPGGDPQEWTTRNEYDEAGNLTKVFRPRKVTHGSVVTELFTETKYDELNRPFQTLGAFDPSDEEPGYQQPVSTYLRYDDLGRLSAQSMPTKATTPPAVTTDQWTRFTHFGSGEVATSVDPTGIKTTYEYDLLGKQTARTMTGADATGQPTSRTRTMTWSYNVDGSLKERTDAASASTALVRDNADATVSGTWDTVTGGAGEYGGGYRAHAAAPGGSDKVTWKITPSDKASYRIEFSCPDKGAAEPAGSRTAAASYTLTNDGAASTLTGDQTGCTGGWRSLGAPVTLDPTKTATLSLSPSADGVTVADAVRLVATDAKKSFNYGYDRNGQQTSVTNGEASARVSKYETTYDGLGRATLVKELAGTSAVRETTYGYDENSNVLSIVAKRFSQAGAGSDDRGNAELTSSTSYAWDARNLVDTVTKTTAGGTARTWDYTWNSRGLLETLTKPDAAGTKGAGNVVSLKYFDNGLLKDKTERKKPKPDGTLGDVVSSHQLTYNPDGDPVRDIAKVQNPEAASSYRTQTTRYSYTPGQQLRDVEREGFKAGKDEEFLYDPAGNITRQKIGDVTTVNEYLHNRLKTTTASAPGTTSSTSNYVYDDWGRLTNVNGDSPADYTYDGWDRIIAQTHGKNTSLVSTTTTYDPFDRPTVRSVVKGAAGTAKKTRFNYLGLSKQVAGEEQTDAGGAWKLTTVYTYGPDGKPLALTTTPLDGSAGKTRYYSTNTHGDTEALTDPGTGDVKASYRYTAYGSEDANGTLGEDKTPTTGGPAEEVLNPYRYSSKRLDPVTGSYDMGFRTYNPGLNSFLTRDMYNGALGDLKLGMDPWNTNRYAFAGGNPITRIELDGHKTVDISGGPAACSDIDCARAAAHAAELEALQVSCTSWTACSGDGPMGVPVPTQDMKVGVVVPPIAGLKELITGRRSKNDTLFAPAPAPDAGTTARTYRRERCLDSSGGNAIYYLPLVNERATGAFACLRQAYSSADFDSRDRHEPKDWEKGMHRGHLIARMFGGSNTAPENFVPLNANANLSAMKRAENSIQAALRRGEKVFYVATPIYFPIWPQRKPVAVHLQWYSTNKESNGSATVWNVP